jgi:WD40 repeat protein
MSRPKARQGCRFLFPNVPPPQPRPIIFPSYNVAMERPPATLYDAPIVAHQSAPIRQIAFSGDGSLMATADTDRWLKIYHEGRLVMEKWLKHPNDRLRSLDRIRSMAFDRHGRTIYVASGESVRGLDLLHGETVWETVAGPTFGFLITTPLSLDVGSNNQVAVAYADGHIEIADPAWGLHSRRWHDNDGPQHVRFMNDGHRIIGCDYFALCIWDTTTGTKVARYVPDERLYAMEASPIHPVVATRSRGHVLLWHAETGASLARIPVGPGLPSMAFSNQRRWVAAGDADGTSVFDFEGNLVARLESPRVVPLSLAFSPRGSLYIGSSDGIVREWEVA